jgi:Zn-dependent M28 family amino/carboxypeptidase
MHRTRITLLLIAAMLMAFLAVAQSTTTGAAIPAPVQRSLDAISADAIRAHVRFLSSDLLEGRGPGTRGDAIATNYIASQFEMLGLEPAGDNNTYFQKVSLLGLQLDGEKSSASFVKDGTGAGTPLKYLDEYVGNDQTQRENSTIDSEIIFVGHGVVAPEYRWDDYKGIDTRGKTLVMLVNDPPATAAEPDLFKGRARTYYGRWSYKFETGAAKNADAVILIHTDDAAGYGWQVVRNSWGTEGSYVRNVPGEPALQFAGWITGKVAADLFRAAGQDLDALTRAAGSRNFRPVPLGHRFRANLTTKIRPFDTQNVTARLPGADAKLKGEAVLYTAHHDHLGIGKADETGDAIYNGAIDNGTGTGLLIELARVWSQASPRPKRSILFSAVAAEEQGLLGSAFLGKNPPIPEGKIAVALNFDGIYQIGRVRDVTMIGVEQTTFHPTAQKVTGALGLTIVPDQSPEQGFYYRSDHFSLAKVGIPAFSIDAGEDVIGKPAGFGKQMSDEYRAKHYHQPSDEIEEGWDWSSAQQMAQLGFWLGWEAANAAELPNWLPGAEFRALRDKSMAAAAMKK